MIIQHLYSATGSYWDTEALVAPVKTEVGFEIAFESLQSMTGDWFVLAAVCRACVVSGGSAAMLWFVLSFITGNKNDATF